MNMVEIREIARSKNMIPGHQKKSELIRSIQRKEGNFDCFGTATAGVCTQTDCLWRKDCLGPEK